MASVERRDGRRSASFVVRYRDDTGKQRSKSFNNKAEAQSFAYKTETQLREGDWIDPLRGRTLFEDFHARWVAARTVSPSRASAEASQAKNHILPKWGSVPLGRIKPLDVDAWVKTMQAGTPTKVMALAQFKLCLDAAVREGILRTNPAAITKAPSLPRKRVSRADVLDAAELDKLVSEVPDHWKALVYLSGWLGWRWSEAMGLRVRDFDFSRGVVHIGNEVAVEVAGVIHRRTGGKTAAATRTVALPEPARDVARWHVGRLSDPSDPSAWVFVTEAGHTPSRSNFLRVFRAAVTRAGLEGRGLNIRQLRHTAASLMLSSGLDILDVQERLGHARGSVTLDIYGRVLNSRREAGNTALGDAMGSSAYTLFTHTGAKLSVPSATTGGPS